MMGPTSVFYIALYPRIFWFYFPSNSINVCSNQISSLDQQHLTYFVEHIALLLSYLVSENPRKAEHYTDEATEAGERKHFTQSFIMRKVQGVTFREEKVVKVSPFPPPCVSLAHNTQTAESHQPTSTHVTRSLHPWPLEIK